MAKHFAVAALFVSAFCFASVLARDLHEADGKFCVEGKVYCDPCRLAFMTRLSHPLADTLVTLACHMVDDATNITYFTETKTDANGHYSLIVDGDHQYETCKVMAQKSVQHKCSDPMREEADTIVLTRNSGVTSSKRFVNPLGFMTHTIDARCLDVLKELGLDESQY